MKLVFIILTLMALSPSHAIEPTKLINNPSQERTIKPSERSEHGTIVSQNYYYAKPGKEAEVLSWRLHVCDILEQLGCKRGRVLRRLKKQQRR